MEAPEPADPHPDLAAVERRPAARPLSPLLAAVLGGLALWASLLACAVGALLGFIGLLGGPVGMIVAAYAGMIGTGFVVLGLCTMRLVRRAGDGAPALRAYQGGVWAAFAAFALFALANTRERDLPIALGGLAVGAIAVAGALAYGRRQARRVATPRTVGADPNVAIAQVTRDAHTLRVRFDALRPPLASLRLALALWAVPCGAGVARGAWLIAHGPETGPFRADYYQWQYTSRVVPAAWALIQGSVVLWGVGAIVIAALMRATMRATLEARRWELVLDRAAGRAAVVRTGPFGGRDEAQVPLAAVRGADSGMREWFRHEQGCHHAPGLWLVTGDEPPLLAFVQTTSFGNGLSEGEARERQLAHLAALRREIAAFLAG